MSKQLPNPFPGSVMYPCEDEDPRIAALISVLADIIEELCVVEQPASQQESTVVERSEP